VNEQLTQTLQQQLRDVHLPSEISWWPLAFGWWLLIGASFVCLIALTIYVRRQRRKAMYRKTALAELNHAFDRWRNDQDTARYLRAANAVLKRCVLHIAPEQHLVARTGKLWLNTLNEFVKQPLSSKTENALTKECYQAQPGTDIESLHTELRAWLGSHRPRNLAEINKVNASTISEASHA